MRLPLVNLEGTPYDQGYVHGVRLRAEIGHNLRCYVERFFREAGLTQKDILHRAAIYGAAIADAHPDYHAGMRGIADGAGLELDEVTALNVRYEILYFQYAMRQMMSVRDGCTAFALAPHRTANGHLWLGQNWDWIPNVKGALIHTTHGNGCRTLAFTEAGIFGGKIGLNSAGLGLAINGITTTDDDWQRLTAPFHVRCYDILLQQNLEDALAVVQREARACSANFLIAQRPDRVVDLEAAPETTKRISWHDGVVVHANHFVDPRSIDVEEPPDEHRRFSCLRQDRLQTFMAETPVIRRSQLQAWLKDHANAPRSICRHEDESVPVDEQYRTVTSVVIDLHDGNMWATAGPPCQSSYYRFSI